MAIYFRLQSFSAPDIDRWGISTWEAGTNVELSVGQWWKTGLEALAPTQVIGWFCTVGAMRIYRGVEDLARTTFNGNGRSHLKLIPWSIKTYQNIFKPPLKKRSCNCHVRLPDGIYIYTYIMIDIDSMPYSSIRMFQTSGNTLCHGLECFLNCEKNGSFSCLNNLWAILNDSPILRNSK
jgi:hypothetical protein